MDPTCALPKLLPPTPPTLACGLLRPYPPTAADLLLKVRLKSRYWRIVDGEMFTQEVRCGWVVSRLAGQRVVVLAAASIAGKCLWYIVGWGTSAVRSRC